jgi:hypothetical protein
MQLPFMARSGPMLLVFAVEILLLHVLLVWLPWFRLSRAGWTKARYVSLAFAVLSILAAVANARQLIAKNFSYPVESRMESSYRFAREELDDYTIQNGPICRTFHHGPYSPPPMEFNQMQREYDQACQWFKQLANALPKELPADGAEVSWSELPSQPPLTDDIVLRTVNEFRQSIAKYNQDAEQYRELQDASHPSSLGSVLVALLPVFLSLALALEITRVTGELRILRLTKTDE